VTTFACPKLMVHGPCGGVGGDGSCEVADEPCVFLDQPVVPFLPCAAAPQLAAVAASVTGAQQAPGMQMRQLLQRGRAVVSDFPAAALDVRSIAASAAILHGTVDAVLAGDAPRNRVQFSPSYRASLIRDAGLAAWAGINCRDRNRVAIEGELAGLAHVGVAGVHCVTGDHPALGSRPDAAAVFDLDSTEVAALARSAGLLVSVAESPATPPTAQRSARLVEKVKAGAEVCYVNHCGGPSPVGKFITAVRRLGVDPWFLACVPVVVNRASAELLASFPSMVLPPGFLERILTAADPRSAGIDATVELAEAMLAVPGVAGVNLSGGGAPGEELAFAADLAEIGARLRSSRG
jgi:5,10-methylenetetrahydrofolate reductase